MDSNTFDPPAGGVPPVEAPLRRTARDALKIVIVGGFGAGKTTLVGSVSEIRPLSTEEVMTEAGEGVDDLTGVHAKRATTVAFDFGRISLDESRVLYLFGMPGQERFRFLWERLFTGSLGAVALVDTRRLADSFHCIDRLEAQAMPFVVAVNRFPGARPPLDRVRDALRLDERVPLVECDARARESSKGVLIALVRYLTRLREDPDVREGTR
ncbi:GTP-binding protein [Actinomadura rifamycini]|uniref:GTP-binding protein n=1 Tax=Actinomadura rifamycini TaxID=31962 RepID=UPI00041C3B15|nr:ATP/GTP-binding protein [Actinomadura rifamycini]